MTPTGDQDVDADFLVTRDLGLRDATSDHVDSNNTATLQGNTNGNNKAGQGDMSPSARTKESGLHELTV